MSRREGRLERALPIIIPYRAQKENEVDLLERGGSVKKGSTAAVNAGV